MSQKQRICLNTCLVLHLSVCLLHSVLFNCISHPPASQRSLSASLVGSSVVRVSALFLLSSAMERTTAATTLTKPTVVRVTEERNTPRSKEKKSKRIIVLSLSLQNRISVYQDSSNAPGLISVSQWTCAVTDRMTVVMEKMNMTAVSVAHTSHTSHTLMVCVWKCANLINTQQLIY